MLVIARDIEDDLPDDSPMREDVVMLQKQLTLCRTVLQGLREQHPIFGHNNFFMPEVMKVAMLVCRLAGFKKDYSLVNK
jgi:hypothetical protein